MSNLVEVVISSQDQTSAGFKSANRGARDVGAGFDRVGESADGAEGKAQGFSDTLTGTKDLASGTAEIMKGNLFEGFVMVGQGAADLAGGLASFVIPAVKNMTVGMIKNAASTVASTAANLAASTAAKAMAVAQWLLNAAVAAFPIILIVAGIAAFVAVLIVAYKKSETFRNIVNAAFSSVGGAILAMAGIGLRGVKLLLEGFLNMVGGVLNAVAKIPGPTQNAAKSAAKSFNDFKNSALGVLDSAINKVDEWGVSLNNMPKIAKLQGDITDLTSKINEAKEKLKDKGLTATKRAEITANIYNLQKQVNAAQTKIDTLKGKTVTVDIKSRFADEAARKAISGATGGHVTGNAHGGIFGGGRTWVGEHGRELVDLPPGSQIHSNDTSEGMANSGSSAGSVEEAAMMIAEAVLRMLDENTRGILRAAGARA